MTEIKQTNKQTNKKTRCSCISSSSYLQYFLNSDWYVINYIHFMICWKLVQIWLMDDVSCIGSKVGHQIESLSLPHCLRMLHWHFQLVLSRYLHQPESHQLSLQQPLLLTDRQTDIGTHRSDPSHLCPIEMKKSCQPQGGKLCFLQARSSIWREISDATRCSGT